MKVILKKKLGRRGRIGDQIIVKKGFARNYLFPRGEAVPATAANMAAFEEQRAELERVEAEQVTAAEARKATIEAAQLTIAMKAGDEGKLFGSVGAQDIVDAAAQAQVSIERSEVRMPDGPLRATGEHLVEIHIYEEINAQLPVTIVAD